LNVVLRLFSLIALIAVWYGASEIADARTLPGPDAVVLAMWHEAQSAGVPTN